MAFILLILPKRQKKYFGEWRMSMYTPVLVLYFIFVYLYIYIIFVRTYEGTVTAATASDNLFIWNLLYLIWLSMVAVLREASLYGGMIEIPSFCLPYSYFFPFFRSFSFSILFVSLCICIYISWIGPIFGAVVVGVPFWIILSVYCFARCFFK